jgi:hypothetical protein
VLWDLSAGALGLLNYEEVRRLASSLAALRVERDGGAAAIVCARDADFGLARVLWSYAEAADPAGERAVFRDASEAWRWMEDAAAEGGDWRDLAAVGGPPVSPGAKSS